MATRIAISGFGRIGRNVLRAIVEAKRRDVEVVAINDLVSAKDNAHLFKHDSVHGPFPGEVKVGADSIDVGMGPIKVLAERDPKKLPWKDLGIDIVMECTGIFTDREKAAQHLEAGAKRVLVSAPSKGADLTVVYGVNHGKLTAEHKVVSNASCTTNCLAPVAKVLNDLVGIKSGYMTTIHEQDPKFVTLGTNKFICFAVDTALGFVSSPALNNVVCDGTVPVWLTVVPPSRTGWNGSAVTKEFLGSSTFMRSPKTR